MTYATLRDGPRSVATKYHAWVVMDVGAPYRSYQPDCLDDEQFNTLIEVPEEGVYMVQSINFDFYTDEEVESE